MRDFDRAVQQIAVALQRVFRRLARALGRVSAPKGQATIGYRDLRAQAALYAGFTTSSTAMHGHSAHSLHRSHGLFQIAPGISGSALADVKLNTAAAARLRKQLSSWGSSLSAAYGVLYDTRMNFPAGVVAAQKGWEGYE